MPPETAPGQPARMWCDTFGAVLMAARCGHSAGQKTGPPLT
jgi:hypothetical protein